MMRMGEPIRLSQKTGNLDTQAEMRKEQASRQYGRLPDQDQDQDNGHLKEMTSVMLNSTVWQGILASKQYGPVNTETRRDTHGTAGNLIITRGTS